MIELHRPAKDEPSDEIEQRLDDMTITYKTERYNKESQADFDLPYIKEGKTVVTGEDKIEKYLRELEAELKLQRSVSGDYCYIDPDSGEVC